MIMEQRKMERKRTLTMNWDGLHDQEDDSFFESRDRMSSAVPIDLDGSSSDDDDFDDSRMSFASCVSSLRNDVDIRALSGAAAEPSFTSAPLTPDYNIWMAAPGSISERRRRLMQGMGLANGGKDIVSFKRIVSNINPNGVLPAVAKSPTLSVEKIQLPAEAARPEPEHSAEPEASISPPPVVVLVRSRSEGEIEAFSADKRRKEEVMGTVSKQRLTRTSSTIAAPSAKMCSYYSEAVGATPQSDGAAQRQRQNSTALSTEFTNNLGAFFLIKNLDTGTEFIVNEYDQNGCWNKFSDLQTGKKLTMDEFEKSVGYSPVVKEVMRRQSVTSVDVGTERKVGAAGANSFVSKSLRMSKRKVALLKNSIKGVGSAVSVLIGEKDQHASPPPPPLPQDQKPGKSSSEWIKVRHSGKSYKELSALHLCQEIQAHEGSIWTIKFSLDARFLASAGEDRVIHVWEIQECEIMSLDSNATPVHPSLCSSQDRSPSLSSEASISSEKKKKGKGGSSRKTNVIPDYVHVPEFVFALSEKPVCTFEGHLDAVLDLSWSRDQLLLSSSMDKTVRLWDMETKSCLKMFAHNDYVTCIQFNPLDDNVFLSGSLDAKLRLWDIPARKVVDWTDLHEMVTAACYTPDGQAAVTGSHKGNCRMYNAEDCRLSQEGQIDIKNKKKNQSKKITGFQFSPINPSEMLVTSADSRIRIVDGDRDVTHKFRGFRNTSSQIGASFSPNGKYIICASEDSNVYVWKREEPRVSATGKKSTITTTSHEYFQCKDVSVAIPWPGTIKGDPPPPMPVHSSKRHSKRSSIQPVSGAASPTPEESKRLLPPLPKKNTNPSTPPPTAVAERPSSPPTEDQDPSDISRTDSGIGESFNSSDPSSIRYSGDSSSSIFSGNASSSWSSSWSSLFGHESSQTTQAWGLVIVTATLEGEIRAYQNFGIPRRVQSNIFGGPT
ncbi:uncharacterized protein LOC126799687 [Argentina anserina]|uniref:uncharacterized protein LOC126799687 n=1 Tax=Argentina anserina TaxID=57926 RepID=UPI0021763D87|nr:uncharacterized protein LOC126799687 [Potentilla anserina]